MHDLASLVHLLGPLAVATGVGLVLGLEREMSHKPAGLRTQVLVTVGTAVFVLAGRSLGVEGARIAANVVPGLGFLGAGVILQHRGAVRGLTTAALIWVNGGLGLAAGLENYPLAGAGAVIALLTLQLLGRVEKRMATKCNVLQYQVTARESDELLRVVHEALSRCHLPEGPLSFDRQDGKIVIRFGFCNPPARHQEFVEKLHHMPEVMDLKVE
jgi:putative Mg2+ transporter-C (MgtC) family protein